MLYVGFEIELKLPEIIVFGQNNIRPNAPELSIDCLIIPDPIKKSKNNSWQNLFFILSTNSIDIVEIK